MSYTVKQPYKHDCDNCVFVGWYENKNMWFCPRSHPQHPNDLGTIILRNSDKPSDYWSQSVWRDRKPTELVVYDA